MIDGRRRRRRRDFGQRRRRRLSHRLRRRRSTKENQSFFLLRLTSLLEVSRATRMETRHAAVVWPAATILLATAHSERLLMFSALLGTEDGPPSARRLFPLLRVFLLYPISKLRRRRRRAAPPPPPPSSCPGPVRACVRSVCAALSRSDRALARPFPSPSFLRHLHLVS